MTEREPDRLVLRRALLRAGGIAAAGLGVAGAGPAGGALARPSRQGWIRSTIAGLSLQQKVGQLLISYVYGADADTADSRNTDRYGVATPAEVVRKYGLGGVIYFDWTDNIDSPRQLARLSNGLQRVALGSDRPRRDRDRGDGIGLIISTDQETGRITRVGPPATQFPGAMSLGAGRNAEACHDTYAITAAELRALGISATHAPVADVNVNQANPVINTRSFGGDPELVAEMTAAAVRGLQTNRMSATAKHFPGHGDTNVDSHQALPEITHTRSEWEQIDAPPFAAAVAAGSDMIMTAHIRFPSLDESGDPATLSRPILTGLLREHLGFSGVVITDSLGMAGVRQLYTDDEIAVRAVEAGADLLLSPVDVDLARNGLLRAIRSGRLPERRIDQSLERLLTLKWNRGLVSDPIVDEDGLDEVVGTTAHHRRAEEIAAGSSTLLINDSGSVPLPNGSVLVTGWGSAAGSLLADQLAADGRKATHFHAGTTPSQAAIDEAVARAGDHDVTIVLTHTVRNRPTQSDLVDALRGTGKPVIVVAVGEPYDIAHLDGVRCYLASYSAEPIALRAAARVLLGQIPAAGRLPVAIGSASDPDSILYPYGSGLTG